GEHVEQQRVLRVHAVLGLVVDDRLRRVDDVVGDLQAALGREAVHEDSGGGAGAAGLLHEFGGYLVLGEDFAAFGNLVDAAGLAHGDPDVGVDGVVTLDGVQVGRDVELRPRGQRKGLA